VWIGWLLNDINWLLGCRFVVVVGVGWLVGVYLWLGVLVGSMYCEIDDMVGMRFWMLRLVIVMLSSIVVMMRFIVGLLSMMMILWGIESL